DGNLAYLDTVRVMSAPVFLEPPPPPAATTQETASGIPVALSSAPWAGHPAVAADGTAIHAVWQQRAATVYEIAYGRSLDGGATWSSPVVLSAGEDARTPAIAAAGGRVVVAWERHPGSRHGGVITLRTSIDGGSSFGSAEVVNDLSIPAARPALALTPVSDHLVWMSMEDGYKIRYARRSGGGWSAPVRLSSAEAYDGPDLSFVLPPRKLRHVPAAALPTIAASGDRVAVAWEDDREDPTPLRNGTPDDWGIYAAFSTDGGGSWSADRRITPRHDATPPDPDDPEQMEGNPARHASLAYASSGGPLVLAYDDPFGSGGANVYVQRSSDGGESWSAPVAVSAVTPEFAYRPALVAAQDGFVDVVWQASQGRLWSLRRAASADSGESFSPEAPFTTGTGYAGRPRAAGGVVVWSGEAAGTYRVFAARF
ncbi:MAG: sialidase family protein, partial [Candidatus Binatia bacterium]